MTKSRTQRQVYEEFSNLFKSNYNLMSYKAEQNEKALNTYNEVVNIVEDLEKEERIHKQAITTLKTWYAKSKEMEINKLQDRINTMLSKFFGHDYNLQLVQGVRNNKDVINLTATGYDGSRIDSIGVILSGAEQQMAGYLIQAATTEANSNGLMVLDEAFSSFGVEEVTNVPRILTFVDKQILIIEHKDELFEEFPVLTYVLENANSKGTRIKEIIPKDELFFEMKKEEFESE